MLCNLCEVPLSDSSNLSVEGVPEAAAPGTGGETLLYWGRRARKGRERKGGAGKWNKRREGFEGKTNGENEGQREGESKKGCKMNNRRGRRKDRRKREREGGAKGGEGGGKNAR